MVLIEHLLVLLELSADESSNRLDFVLLSDHTAGEFNAVSED